MLSFVSFSQCGPVKDSLSFLFFFFWTFCNSIFTREQWGCVGCVCSKKTASASFFFFFFLVVVRDFHRHGKKKVATRCKNHARLSICNILFSYCAVQKEMDIFRVISFSFLALMSSSRFFSFFFKLFYFSLFSNLQTFRFCVTFLWVQG